MENTPMPKEIVRQMAQWRDACLIDGTLPVMLVTLEDHGDDYVPRVYLAGYLHRDVLPVMMDLLRQCGEAHASGAVTEGTTDVR